MQTQRPASVPRHALRWKHEVTFLLQPPLRVYLKETSPNAPWQVHHHPHLLEKQKHHAPKRDAHAGVCRMHGECIRLLPKTLPQGALLPPRLGRPGIFRQQPNPRHAATRVFHAVIVRSKEWSMPRSRKTLIAPHSLRPHRLSGVERRTMRPLHFQQHHCSSDQQHARTTWWKVVHQA